MEGRSDRRHDLVSVPTTQCLVGRSSIDCSLFRRCDSGNRHYSKVTRPPQARACHVELTVAYSSGTTITSATRESRTTPRSSKTSCKNRSSRFNQRKGCRDVGRTGQGPRHRGKRYEYRLGSINLPAYLWQGIEHEHALCVCGSGSSTALTRNA